MPGAELRGWVELAVLVFVAVLGIGRLLQKRDDADVLSRASARKDYVDREFRGIKEQFENANKEMSRLASYVQGIDTRWRSEFVTRDVCDARMSAVQRELNGDWSKGNP